MANWKMIVWLHDAETADEAMKLLGDATKVADLNIAITTVQRTDTLVDRADIVNKIKIELRKLEQAV